MDDHTVDQQRYDHVAITELELAGGPSNCKSTQDEIQLLVDLTYMNTNRIFRSESALPRIP